MTLTPRENYLRVLRGEIPEYLPSFFDKFMDPVGDFDMLYPCRTPDGPKYSPWGVKFVGGPENDYGALPEPGNFILKDITKWRDVIKNPDMTGFDWERYFADPEVGGNKDRKQFAIGTSGGDYFQTLVSFMGFEGALMAMYEEPDEVYELFDYISQYIMLVVKNAIYYCKPEIYLLADDIAAERAPFVSVDMYRRLLEPFYKRHCDLALENNMLIDHHNCGKSGVFIPDWLEMGISSWNPAQTCNDLVTIKKEYGDRLTMQGCWDNTGYISSLEASDEELEEALYKYVDTFAPGGHFIFLAIIHGNREDERFKRKMGLIKNFYESYARDWYKTH